MLNEWRYPRAYNRGFCNSCTCFLSVSFSLALIVECLEETSYNIFSCIWLYPLLNRVTIRQPLQKDKARNIEVSHANEMGKIQPITD